MSKLDYTALDKAIASLEKGVMRSRQAPEDEELRDCVIQRFEYTYELSWKMVKRRLERDSASPGMIEQYSFKELMRTAAEKGFISNVEEWFGYREARNMTSHSYNEKVANEVYQTAFSFLKEVKQLITKLNE